MFTVTSRLIRAVILVCACLSCLSVAADDKITIASDRAAQQLLAEAETLIAAGRSDAAYTMLKGHEATLAGDTFFDYLLGVAALDAGLHSEAIFSLRRAVAVSPDFAGARMELARAYFDSNNKALARSLFVSLRNEKPPPDARTVIENYIAAIDAPTHSQQARFAPFIEFGAGYDSNANGSTDSQTFLGFTLSPDNLKTASPFSNIAAGFNFSKPRSNQSAWYAGTRLAYRHNPDASFVNAGVISGLGGLSWNRGTLFGRAGLEGYRATRDGDPNSSYAGIDAQLGTRLANGWSAALGLRSGAMRYDDKIKVLDVDRLLYTGTLYWQFSPLGRVAIELIGGDDSAKQTGSPYGNSKFGGRLQLNVALRESANLSASIGSLTSDYDGMFFGAAREDRQFTASLQIEIYDVLTNGLSLIPSLRFVDNDSDIALYKYDRTEFGVLLRWTPQ